MSFSLLTADMPPPRPVKWSKQGRKLVSVPGTMALSAEAELVLAPLRQSVKEQVSFLFVCLFCDLKFFSRVTWSERSRKPRPRRMMSRRLWPSSRPGRRLVYFIQVLLFFGTFTDPRRKGGLLETCAGQV